eukprot:Pgem_evm1s6047
MGKFTGMAQHIEMSDDTFHCLVHYTQLCVRPLFQKDCVLTQQQTYRKTIVRLNLAMNGKEAMPLTLNCKTQWNSTYDM